MTNIVTRFAPSPTGYMHLGNARTALFNWLYAKHMGGKFLLRIEDTDRARSTESAVKIIIDSLIWMGLQWDGEIIYQSQRQKRHIEVAKQLLESGNAYYCYMSQEEIAQAQNSYTKIFSPWRNVSKAAVCPSNIKPVVRLKAEISGTTIIKDAIYGVVEVENKQLDDMILLRSDGTPTYMLAVVVDDHDMNVNYVIRGDDHFTNTFRQDQLYKALNWSSPNYAHLPLINNCDGTKLSKRLGAKSVIEYKNDGYLPEALCNYLLLLGWGHKDRESWTLNEAAQIFDIANVNKAPARFDERKFKNVNARYMQNYDSCELLKLLSQSIDCKSFNKKSFDNIIKCVKNAIPQIKTRAKTLIEMVDMVQPYITKQNLVDQKLVEEILENDKIISSINHFSQKLSTLEIDEWNVEKIRFIGNETIQLFNIEHSIFMNALRIIVVGSTRSAGIYNFIEVIGKEETIKRIMESIHTTS